MQNIKELRKDLIENYESIKSDSIDLKKASEMNNTAGKIISTVVTELKYQNQIGKKKEIDFLEYEN